jgi:hypothetical protein
MYLLVASIKGNFKFGSRFFLISVGVACIAGAGNTCRTYWYLWFVRTSGASHGVAQDVDELVSVQLGVGVAVCAASRAIQHERVQYVRAVDVSRRVVRLHNPVLAVLSILLAVQRVLVRHPVLRSRVCNLLRELTQCRLRFPTCLHG